jgi:hypothetical protein
MTQSTQVETPLEKSGTPESEGRFHTYVGNRIPWYVRLIWVFFWVFAIYYVIKYLFPDLQTEILNPP